MRLFNDQFPSREALSDHDMPMLAPYSVVGVEPESELFKNAVMVTYADVKPCRLKGTEHGH